MPKKITWIEASAGSGKTTAIVRRIEELLGSGVSGSSILCLTFTNSAADELKQRVKTSNRPIFSTIHGFAMSLTKNPDQVRIIDECGKAEAIKDAIEIEFTKENFLLESDISTSSLHSMVEDYVKRGVCSDSLQEALDSFAYPKNFTLELSGEARTLIESTGMGEYVGVLQSGDAEECQKHFFMENGNVREPLIKKLSLSAELEEKINSTLSHVLSWQESVGMTKSLKVTIILRRIADTYRKIVRARGMCEYDEILSMEFDAQKMMSIKHVFIDEAQDVSGKQLDFLLRGILQEVIQQSEYSVTVVGDKKQLIYGFNGSSEEVFDKMKSALFKFAKGSGAQWTEESLSKSYRTGGVILDFVDKIMHSTSYTTSHIPHTQKKSRIGIWKKLRSEEELGEWHVAAQQEFSQAIKICIDKIKELKKGFLLNENRPIRDSDIFIITSKRCMATYLLAYELIKNGIKISEAPFSIPTNGMFEEFLQIGEFVIFQGDFSIIAILKGPFFRWKNEDLEELCIGRMGSVWMALKLAESEKAKVVVRVLSEWISWSKDAFNFYAKLFFHSDYGEYVRNFFLEEANFFWEKVLNAKKFSMGMGHFINYMQNGIRSFKIENGGLSILTVHSAKGRENHVVFLFNSHTSPNIHQSPYLPYKNLALMKGQYRLYKKLQNITRLNRLREAERLMYVAITRAKEQLYFLPPVDHENVWTDSFYYRAAELLRIKEEGEFFILEG